MQNAQQSPQPSSRLTLTGSVNIVKLVIRTFATSVEVLLHKDFGDQYLNLHGVAVVVLVPLYTLFWQRHDPRPLMYFLPVYLLGLVIARVNILLRKQNAPRIHGQYSGMPRCIGKRTKLTEMQIKQYVEPIIVGLFGFAFCNYGELPLGSFLMIAGVCLWLQFTMTETEFRRRAAGMSDQVLEQEYVAERFREMQGDRF